jgi:formate-dependent nitrite reductase cytochrome c552 subunit
MTKKLEEILNLPASKEVIKQEEKKKQKALADKPESFLRDVAEFDKIAAALPQVKGLGDIGDSELDELAQKAKDAYEDIMDLGMNVEARYSARLFEVAGSMLKNAIDAKSAKLDKKLKMIELQIKKAKLDQDANSADDSVNLHGDGVIITDRNSLLEKLKQMK